MNAEHFSLQPLFLDTNILVYAFDNAAGRKHEIAAKIVEQCWQDGSGCLSVQVLQEFYVTVTRKLNTPLPAPVARQIIADLAYWKIHVPEPIHVLHAIDFQQEHALSFWDAMIVQSAVFQGCKTLISEDLGNHQHFGNVEIINPFEAVP